MGRQQVSVFVYYSLALLVGFFFNLIGTGGPHANFNQITNLVFFVTALLIFAGYLFRVLKLRFSLNCVVLAMQLITSIEMIACALSPDEYHLMLIVADIVLLVVNILLSLIAYLEVIPVVLCVLSAGTYIACVLITKDKYLDNFVVPFLAVFACLGLLGLRMVRNVRYLAKEYRILEKEEQELLDLLGQSREQVLAYIEISKTRKGTDETRSLLDMVSDKARYNIVNNIKEYVDHKEASELELEKIFPELSPSEIKLCLWILQGKTLSQLCAVLGKTESNISCTRTHIRKKLGLKPEDNLYKALHDRVKGGAK